MDSERLLRGLVALHQLGCGKAERITCLLGMVFDDMGDRMDSAMHLSRTKIQMIRLDARFRCTHHCVHKIGNPLVLSG